MRRGIIRWVIAGLLVILGAGFPAAGMAFATQNGQASKAAQGGGADTLGDLDREFITVIRFANLWEIPMGKMGAERGSTEAVKTAGQTMLSDHTKLNVAIKGLADKYGVALPNKPSSSTQGWMDEITSSGKNWERVWADRLRAAHGTVFGLIAEVRAGTRNPEIRDFATQANNIVMKHMTLLEETKLTSSDHGQFAEAAARGAAYPENVLSKSDILAAGVVFLVVSAGTVLGVRMLSARGAAK